MPLEHLAEGRLRLRRGGAEVSVEATAAQTIDLRTTHGPRALRFERFRRKKSRSQLYLQADLAGLRSELF